VIRSSQAAVLLVLAHVSAAAQEATWIVEPTPILDVPGTSSTGAVTFEYAAGGIRLANGGLLIADRAENTIRVLDASGKLERSLGRVGSGPGEFRSMVWARRCGGDSLLIWDFARRQATIAGSTGTTTRQFAVPAGDTAQVPFQFSCSSKGSIVYSSAPRQLRGRGAGPETPNVVAVTAAVYSINRDGAIRQRYGDVPAGEVVMLVGPTGGRGASPRPLGRAAYVASIGDLVVISSADSAILTFHAADGRSNRHVLPVPVRAPTRAEFEAAVEALATIGPAEARQSLIDRLGEVPIPERLPPVSALFVDTEDMLWVQTTPPGGRVMDFLIVRPDGSVVAKARIPRGLTVFDIGRDYILGSYSDTNDEPHIAAFELRRQ
jgi:hypothetical protein